MNTQITLTSDMLRKAADLSDDIANKQAELQSLLNGQIVVDTSAPRTIHTAGGRRFSPEAIEKIRAAQRRRWRNVRKENAAQKEAAAASVVAPAEPKGSVIIAASR